MSKTKKEIRKTHYTPGDICKLWGVGIEFVLGLIHDGELKASNVSRSSARPRWLIAESDAGEFLERRSNQQKKAAKPVARRTKPRREYV